MMCGFFLFNVFGFNDKKKSQLAPLPDYAHRTGPAGCDCNDGTALFRCDCDAASVAPNTILSEKNNVIHALLAWCAVHVCISAA